MDKVYALLVVAEGESESWIAVEISPAFSGLLEKADHYRALAGGGGVEMIMEFPDDARMVSEDAQDALLEAGYEAVHFLGEDRPSASDVAAKMLDEDVRRSARHVLRMEDMARVVEGVSSLASAYRANLDLKVHVRSGEVRLRLSDECASWWQSRQRDVEALLADAAAMSPAPAPGCF